MSTNVAEQVVHTLEIVKEEEIVAPIEIVFETILEQMGPYNEGNGPMPMVLEAWPGGRWYRDLGNDAGHFWGNVQAIKPPTLLEICGPLFMSLPAVCNESPRISVRFGELGRLGRLEGLRLGLARLGGMVNGQIMFESDLTSTRMGSDSDL